MVVWDNLKSCVSAAMAELADARDWLTVYQLPPYAHELNPVEPVWSHLKRSLANLAKRNLAQLTALVKTRLRRMQYRPALPARAPRRLPRQQSSRPGARCRDCSWSVSNKYPQGSLRSLQSL